LKHANRRQIFKIKRVEIVVQFGEKSYKNCEKTGAESMNRKYPKTFLRKDYDISSIDASHSNLMEERSLFCRSDRFRIYEVQFAGRVLASQERREHLQKLRKHYFTRGS